MIMMQRNNVGVINDNFRYTHDYNERHRCFKVWDTFFEVEAKYKPIDPIGRGAYGVVCSSIDTVTYEKVAIKKINVLEDSKEALKVLRELRILRHVCHENVISLKDVMITSANCEDVYMVFELMDYDLGSFIRSSPRISNNLVEYFMFQLLNGLNYLHSSNIIHRDLKPENLLVNAKNDLKISDFGLATTTKGSPETQPATDYIVTLWYRAPELLLKCSDTYGPSIDVWSAGCIFAELLGQEPLFLGDDELDQLMAIIDILGTQKGSNLGFITNPRVLSLFKSWNYTPGIDFASLFPNADLWGLDLLSKMLEFNPQKRITAAEALQHPYFQNMYDHHKRQPTPSPCQINVEAHVGVEQIRSMIWREMLFYHPNSRG